MMTEYIDIHRWKIQKLHACNDNENTPDYGIHENQYVAV